MPLYITRQKSINEKYIQMAMNDNLTLLLSEECVNCRQVAVDYFGYELVSGA
jgi:hypothetical protein